MRVLVTGGAGFIGSRVVGQLLSRGHEVVAVVRASPHAKVLPDDSQLQIVTSDVHDFASVERISWQFDSCIHLAWYAEPGQYLASSRNFESLNATLALLKSLASNKCGSIVMAGTCAEYASQLRPLLETDPVQPTTLYAATKLAALTVAEQFCRLHDIRFAWARIFFLYGPGEDGRRAIPNVINALHRGESFDATEGNQIRDFLHVDDVASAFVILSETHASGLFNVSSGEGATMRTVFKTIEELLNRRGAIRFGAIPTPSWESPMIVGENSKLKSLGWKPRVPLKEGLESLIRYACKV